MTLLEVMIAMVLTSIVMMTVLYFYQDVIFIGAEIDRARKDEFYMRYVENRLMNTLSRAVSKTDQAGDFVFFSVNDDGLTKPGSQSLIFIFDNGFSMEKAFSNHVLGRLFIDKEGLLTLVYWPSPKRWEKDATMPMKKEILLENVDSLAFEFFIAPEKVTKQSATPASDSPKPSENGKKNKDPSSEKVAETPARSPEPKNSWTSQPWVKEYEQLPVMVKVIVTLGKKPNAKEQEKMIFAFPLVNSDSHIVYE